MEAASKQSLSTERGNQLAAPSVVLVGGRVQPVVDAS